MPLGGGLGSGQQGLRPKNHTVSPLNLLGRKLNDF
jgi:hypothetical protein